MSAILKALKKLEQEGTEAAGAPFPGQGGRHPGRKQSKSWIVPGLLVVIVCAFTGIGVSIVARKPSVPESAKMIIKEAKPVPVVNTHEKSKNRSSTLETAGQSQKNAAVPEERNDFSPDDSLPADSRLAASGNGLQKAPDAESKSPQLPAASPEAARTRTADPFSSIIPVPETADENSHSHETDAGPAIPTQRDVRPAKAPVSGLSEDGPADEKPVFRKSSPPLEIIDDPAIELQAISFSADPDKRLAIINGKICREKDRVGSYVIEAINSGDVVLSRGSVSGKLVFDIR